MKKALQISLLFLLTYSFADVNIKYTDLEVTGISTDFEIVGHNTVYNDSTVSDTLVWIRTKANTSSGWFTAGCDNEACWFPEIDSNEFYIAAGDSSNLDIYFYPEGNEGEGDVEILLYRKAEGRDKGITLSYKATATTSTSVADLISSGEISIYPLPVADFLNIDARSNDVSQLMVSSLTGQVLLSSSFHAIDVSSLNPGVYLLQFLKDDELLSYRFVKE